MKTPTLSQRTYAYHFRDSVKLNSSPQMVFAFIDNHHQFSSHMSGSSWMMGGSKMEIVLDSGRGQPVGSHIILSGKVFGISLFVDEIITQYKPPHRKAWETVGKANLVVIGHYRMELQVESMANTHSRLTVSIDYNLPSSNPWLGKLLGKFYASWCVRQMTAGVLQHFNRE